MQAIRGKLVTFALMGLTLLASGMAFGQAGGDSLALYQSALKESDGAKRLTLLTALVKAFPGFLEAQYALGAEFYRHKQFENAIPYFEDLLKNNPTFAQKVGLQRFLAFAYNEVATQAIASGQPEAAFNLLQKAISIAPSLARLYYTLGNAYYQLNRFEKAITAYQKGLSLKVDDPSVEAAFWYNLGVAYDANGRFRDASNAYQKALLLQPGLEKASENLRKAQNKIFIAENMAAADSALSAHNPALAQELLKKVLEMDSTRAEAKKRLTQAHDATLYQKAQKESRQKNWKQALNTLDALPDDYRDVATLRRKWEKKWQTRQAEQKIKMKYERAKRMYVEGRYDSARILFQQIPQRRRNRLDIEFYLNKLDSISAIALHTVTPSPSNFGQKKEPPRFDTAGSKQELLASKNVPVFAAGESPSGLTNPVRSGKSEIAVKGGKNWLKLVFWLVLGFVFILSITYVFQYVQHRKEFSAPGQSEHPGLNRTEEKVEALKEIDEEEQPRKPGGKVSSPGEKERQIVEEAPESISESDLENVIADSTEVIELYKDENESVANTDPDILEADEEDFLALIQDEEIQASSFAEKEEVSDLIRGDSTRTIDMSRFKVRKIGRYVIEKEIGRGAGGRVYKAWDPKLDRTVVIKTVSYNLNASEDEINRLKTRVYREAKTAAKLSHPNIVVVYDVEDERTFSYIVMEHVEGPNLRQLLNQERRVEPARAISFVQQVCRALQFAHAEGVVHRDIKPSNILLVGKEKVKVADFGIAKVINHLTLTQTGRVVGTPSYMAPEQIEGAEVDGRADIFSLGVVFYELVTGKRPFVGDSLASLAYKIVHVETVPPSLVNVELSEIYDEIIGQAIAKDPNQRYQNAGEFLKALQKAKAHIES